MQSCSRSRYHRHRFPAEIDHQSFRLVVPALRLELRDVEEMLTMRA
jgi:hypothetical protein